MVSARALVLVQHFLTDLETEGDRGLRMEVYWAGHKVKREHLSGSKHKASSMCQASVERQGQGALHQVVQREVHKVCHTDLVEHKENILGLPVVVDHMGTVHLHSMGIGGQFEAVVSVPCVSFPCR